MNNDLGRFDPPGLYPARPCRDETASGLRAHRTTFCEQGSGRRSDGVAITELSDSTIFTDAGGNGLKHKTAWAGAGDGVLFYDPDNLGTIEEKRQYVFTEWDPAATSDMEALRSVFDSNGDGVFDADDAEWANFKVLVSNADGSTSAQTLTQLGITSIDLTADATNKELPDGSVITGETTFAWGDRSTGMVENTALAEGARGYPVRWAA